MEWEKIFGSHKWKPNMLLILEGDSLKHIVLISFTHMSTPRGKCKAWWLTFGITMVFFVRYPLFKGIW
jgi:hypothetical protein